MVAESYKVELKGCAREPLLFYLKALGILRLVAEQKDSEAKGAWTQDWFELHTRCSREDLLRFFLEDYRPTPLITPWNSASGFWSGTALSGVKQSDTPRLEFLRQVVAQTETLLQQGGWVKKPTKAEKPRMLRLLRSNLPDAVVPWLDTVGALLGDAVSFSPLLGTGGTDARLEFSVNFVGRLEQVMPFKQGSWKPAQARRSRQWLEAALYAVGSPQLIKAAVGQFHPGGVGGPNASQGFEGNSLVNPWDYILMMEGTLLLAGSVARRTGRAAARRWGSFPFSVNPAVAGWGTGSDSDAESTRAELWLPVWGRPAGLAEVAHLLAEGRAQVGRRAAGSGLDFARAVARLGVERGLAGFTRHGLAQRSGRDNHIALPLGYIALPAQSQSRVRLVDEAERWLERVRREAGRDEAPASLKSACRAVDEAIWRLTQLDRADRLQDVLTALGEVEATIARSKGLRDNIVPLPRTYLSHRDWVQQCDDDTTEFRLARCLASIHALALNQARSGAADASSAGVGPGKRSLIAVEPLRAYLEPVHLERDRYVWAANSPQHVWDRGSLCRNLIRVLQRRCLDAQGHGVLTGVPVGGLYYAEPEDVNRFLAGQVDDRRLEGLLRGLILLSWPIKDDGFRRPLGSRRSGKGKADDGARMMPQLYALAKLLFHHGPLPRRLFDPNAEQAGAESGSVEPGRVRELTVRADLALLSRLRRGDIADALSRTVRRLRGAGFTVLGIPRGFRLEDKLPGLVGQDPERIAAALLFPLKDSDVYELMRVVLRNPDGM